MLRPWELQITINTTLEKAIYLQIADEIIKAIKTGKLNSGAALPGSRQMAAKFKVNRNTIVEALNVLLAEGWLVAKERKGTFVADHLPKFKLTRQEKSEAEAKTIAAKPEIIFDDGLPDTQIAPITELAAAYRQIFNRKGRWQLMGYSDSSGDLEFRSAIVQMLNFKRGMQLSTDEIFITRGSQMAMYLTAHCLLTKEDYVVVENPGYKPAWQAFENAGAKLLPVNVDSEGLIIEELEIYLQKYSIKALYITPHHQFPTTVTLSLARRLRLIELSNQYHFTIIEDDYDNEFHFGQRPILPLSSFESLENYVYIGTMSKIVAPALRIGYLASSGEFISKIAHLRKIIDVQGDNIMAQAMLELINEGHIKRHLKKATLHYKNKRDHAETIIAKYLDEKVHFQKPEGGLAFWIVPKKETNLTLLSKKLLEKGIQIMAPEEFSFQKSAIGIRLGYASMSEAQFELGVKEIAKLL